MPMPQNCDPSTIHRPKKAFCGLGVSCIYKSKKPTGEFDTPNARKMLQDKIKIKTITESTEVRVARNAVKTVHTHACPRRYMQ